MGFRGPACAVCVLLAACGSESVNDEPNDTSGGTGGAIGGTGGSAVGGASGSGGAGGTPSGGSAGGGGSAGSGGSTGGSAGTATGGAAGGGNPDPLAALSDEFSSGALDAKWSIYNPSLLESISVSIGQLELLPGDSFWYLNEEGPLVFQLVTGNFRVTTRISVLGENGTGQPDQAVHWAGLMARDPDNVSGPNTVHVVIGKDGQNSPGITLEWSSTMLGATNFGNDAWTSNAAELRICRVGTNLYLYTHDGSSWAPYETISRPDLPATLQVGPVTHANSANPNLLARYEYVHYATVAGVGECTL